MAKHHQGPKVNKKSSTSNPFEILQKESTQKNPDRESPETSKDGPKDCKESLETFQDATIEKQTNMQVEEEDTEEMDLGDLNLDKLEKAIQDPIKGIILAQHVVLLKEEIINTRKKDKSLVVFSDNPRDKIHETIKKTGNEKCGRRSNQQCIKDIGEKLVASGKFSTIKATFSISSKPSQ